MSGGGGGMESVTRPSSNFDSGRPKGQQQQQQHYSNERCGHFQMPLHYPRFTRADYESMPEWKLECLLKEYGLPATGNVEQNRKFAMGAFLWPN